MLKGKICSFDFETTGIDKQDKIIQASFCIFEEGKEPISYDYYVNPGIPIPPAASEINHITDEMVANAPSFKDLAPTFVGIFELCDIFMGYNIVNYDIPQFNRQYFELFKTRYDFYSKPIVDVFNIYKRIKPRNLSAAYLEYTGNPLLNAHSSLADSLATFDIFKGMLSKEHIVADLDKLKELSGTTVPPLDTDKKFKYNSEGVVVFNFGPHINKPVYQELGLLEWMLKKDFSDETKEFVKQLLEKYKV